MRPIFSRPTKLKLALLLILAATVTAIAEIDNFAFRREITGANAGWTRIAVPDSLFARISPDMSDLRIVGVRPDGERFEVPYLLRPMRPDTEQQIGFKLLNQVSAAGGRFLTFEVPTAEPVNEIGLTFSKENFDWKVRLEGSADQKEWFTIADNYRIVGFKNNFTSYRFTTLRFPEAKFRYLRLFVPATEDPGFEQATIFVRKRDDSARRIYPVKSMKIGGEKPYPVTVIDLELENFVPIDALRVRVRDKIDYYRPISIEYMSGKNADNQPVFKRGAADIISSFDPEGFRFPVFLADRLRISVSNQDNPPLDFEGFEVSGTPYEIVAQFPENGRYFLVYGKPDTPRPKYDIVNFKDKIPDQMAEAGLGQEEASGDSIRAATPWMTSPMWLWPVMIAAIALMGFFAYRMLRR